MNGHTKIIMGSHLNLEKLPNQINLEVIEIKPYLDNLLQEYSGAHAEKFEIVMEGDRRHGSNENLFYYLSLKVPQQMNLNRFSQWFETLKNDHRLDIFQDLMTKFGQGPAKHDMVIKSIFYF